MPKQPSSFSFEQSLNALETTVEQLESGDLSLEDALQAFEKGIGLTRDCQQALSQAQIRINTLLEKNGEPVLQPLPAATAASTTTTNKDDEEIPF